MLEAVRRKSLIPSPSRLGRDVARGEDDAIALGWWMGRPVILRVGGGAGAVHPLCPVTLRVAGLGAGPIAGPCWEVLSVGGGVCCFLPQSLAAVWISIAVFAAAACVSDLVFLSIGGVFVAEAFTAVAQVSDLVLLSVTGGPSFG